MAPEYTDRAREKADAAAALQTSLYSLYPMTVEVKLNAIEIPHMIPKKAAATSQLIQESVRQIKSSLSGKS